MTVNFDELEGGGSFASTVFKDWVSKRGWREKEDVDLPLQYFYDRGLVEREKQSRLDPREREKEKMKKRKKEREKEKNIMISISDFDRTCEKDYR